MGRAYQCDMCEGVFAGDPALVGGDHVIYQNFSIPTFSQDVNVSIKPVYERQLCSVCWGEFMHLIADKIQEKINE